MLDSSLRGLYGDLRGEGDSRCIRWEWRDVGVIAADVRRVDMYHVSLNNSKKFSATDASSILEAARASGVILEHGCRTGRCGLCKAPVRQGDTKLLQPEISLSATEAEAGMVLTCCRAATSDLELDISDLGRLSEIKTKILPSRITVIDFPSPTVARVLLRLPPMASLAYLPGQYLDVIAQGLRRSYSIANHPRVDGLIELHIRRVEGGAMSGYWFEAAKINDLVRLEVPLGTFCLREERPKHIVFLATGTGIAPVKAILEEIAAVGVFDSAIHVYWGNRSPEDFYFDLGRFEVPMRYIQLVSGGSASWQGRRGHVQDALIDDGIDLREAAVYACGSPAMISSAEAQLTSRGLLRRRFYSDAFLSSN